MGRRAAGRGAAGASCFHACAAATDHELTGFGARRARPRTHRPQSQPAHGRAGTRTDTRSRRGRSTVGRRAGGRQRGRSNERGCQVARPSSALRPGLAALAGMATTAPSPAALKAAPAAGPLGSPCGPASRRSGEQNSRCRKRGNVCWSVNIGRTGRPSACLAASGPARNPCQRESGACWNNMPGCEGDAQHRHLSLQANQESAGRAGTQDAGAHRRRRHTRRLVAVRACLDPQECCGVRPRRLGEWEADWLLAHRPEQARQQLQAAPSEASPAPRPSSRHGEFRSRVGTITLQLFSTARSRTTSE